MVLLILVLGLLFGSFVNALVWRLKNKRDWVHERSECVHCGHRLAVLDLVPVVSWLVLRGRCRYCGKAISLQYPLVEIMVSSFFVWSFLCWPSGFTGIGILQFCTWLILLVILSALIVYDIRYMLLPNKLVLAAGLVTVIWVIAKAVIVKQSITPIVDSVLGLLSFGGLFYLMFQISKGKWIGGGDVKLGFVLGAWLANPLLSLLAIYTASILGLLLTPIMTKSKRLSMKSKIPFGPMLILGTIIATLYGSKLAEMYSRYTMGL